MMRIWARCLLAAIMAAPLALGGTARAEKATDTLRLAVDQPIRLIDGTLNPNPEANLIDRAVLDTLISYDVATKTYRGQLAESWKQIDDKTLEIKLRRGVKFSDGVEMTADDVIYSFQFAMDPKVNFLFKDSRFGWIDHVAKIDPDTVRVYSKQPTAIMLARLWSGPQIVPAHYHSQLADKTTFGQKPIGTGPYKVASFDPATGKIVLVKNPYYNWGGYEPAAKIGRIEVTTIPDEQTRLAKILVGDLDLVFHVDYDEAKDIVARNPAYKVFVAPTISFSYIFFDSADRSGIHVFKDKRVREALLRSIDVATMRKALLPPEFAAQPRMQAMCHPAHVGCNWSEPPVSYDPAKAKQLLAAAGLGGGFDLELLTWGQGREIAEAVAGDFRKIGVRATVNAATVNVFQTARGEGKAQTQVTLWDNGGGAPDIDTTTQFFYAPSSRNYTGDAELAQWTNDAARELDPAKRDAIYKKLFDKVTAERYGMPLVELPAILVVSKDIAVDSNHMKPEGFLLNRLSWVK
ncbi:MAG TPA: ABC transporter substrate-binding protein [Stellaceae bacterium]|nr:ABC transporter substrate-binding protein [Stellaceae bacterium]